MRPVLAALAAMVVLGLGVFAVVSLFGEQAEAPPVPQLTPAGSLSPADLPPPAVPAPVQTRPDAVDQALPAGPAAAFPSEDALGSGDAGRRIEDSAKNERTGSEPERDRDARRDQDRADQDPTDQDGADPNRADPNRADHYTADPNRADDRPGENRAEHHDPGRDQPGGRPETPSERNERLRREIALAFCDRYHVPRERCEANGSGR